MRDRRVVLVALMVSLLWLAACESGSGGDPVGAPDTVESPDVAPDVAAPDVPTDEPETSLLPVPDATTYYRVGVAEREIGWDEPLPMGGFGLGGGGPESVRWSEGMYDTPMVTAFCIQESATGEFLVLLGIDIIGMMLPDTQLIRAAFVAKVAESLGFELPLDRVVLSASHAHSTADSIGVWGAFPEQLRDQPYIDKVVEQSAAAAAAAYADLRDAEVTLGRGWLDNSPDGDGIGMDGNMTVLAATDTEGASIGSLTVWSSHPTCYGHLNNALSADWVGPFRYRMAELAGGGLHTFLQGPIGAIYPDRSEEAAPRVTSPFTEGYQDPDVDQGDHDMVAGVGYAVAETAETAIQGGEVLPEAPLRVKRHLYDATVTNRIYEMLAIMNVVPREMHECDGERCTEAEAMWFTLGGLHWATMAGEAFPHYGDAVRAKLVEHGATEGDTVVIGLGNDWLGYLITPDEFILEDYQYHRSLSPGVSWLEQHLAALDAIL